MYERYKIHHFFLSFPFPYLLGSEEEAEEKQDSEKPLLELWVLLLLK